MNLIFALAFAHSNAFAGTTFGGGDLGFVGELDAAGAEALGLLGEQRAAQSHLSTRTLSLIGSSCRLE